MYQTNETNQKTFIDKFFFSIYFNLPMEENQDKKQKRQKTIQKKTLKNVLVLYFLFY